jgi:hypothetical protein
MCSAKDNNDVELWPLLAGEGNASEIIWRWRRNSSEEDGNGLLLVVVTPNT